MANDNLMAGLVTGSANAAQDILGLLIQDKLARRRKSEDLLNEEQSFARRLPLEEASKIRVEQAKPRTTFVQQSDGTWLPVEGKVSRAPVPKLTPEEKKNQENKAKLEAGKPKAITSLKGVEANLDSTIDSIKDLLQNEDRLKKGTGLSGYAMGKLPATDAKWVRSKIKSIKAATSLDALTELKKNSGAGLGSASDAEGERLENARAALDPDMADEDVVPELTKLLRIYQGSKQRLREGFELEYGEAAPSNSKTASFPVAGNESTKDSVRKKLGLSR